MLLLLLVALLLRVQAWFPFNAVDEDAIMQMTWGLHLNPLPPGMPPPFPGYPSLFMYLNFVLSLLYQLILVFLGVFASAGEYLASPLARAFTFKAGQLLVAVIGTVHVAVIWKIGREFFDQRIAWLAALIVAFHPHLIFNGHIFKADVPLALFFALLLLYSLRFLRSLQTKDFFAACFVAGLTVICKFNGAIEVLLIPLILWLVRKKMPAKRCWKLLLLSPLFGVLGFLAGAPNWVVHPVKSFLAAYRLAFFNFREYAFYDSFSSTYGRYFPDLWRTLGPVFVILFFLGVLSVFLRRKKEDLVILLSLVMYFLVQGSSDYYGTRVILPLYGGIALIIAKAAFQDIYPFLKKQLLRSGFTIAIFAMTAFFSLGNIRDSVTQFNLWKSTSTWEETLNFRNEHIPASFPFGREMFTPIKAGDRGIWDISDIHEGFFHGDNALPFLNTGLLTEYVLRQSRDEKTKEKIRVRLREYRPFHTISKPQFGPWDGDILFWYHPNPRMPNYGRGKKRVYLPRLYRRHVGNTLFYPLQPYEKNPGFFPLQGNFVGKWLLSSKPLTAISFTLFSPDASMKVKVKVNHREIVLQASRGIDARIVPMPPPLRFQKSPLYRLEAQFPEENAKAFLLVEEESSVPTAWDIDLSDPVEGDPPPLLSMDDPPAWVRKFFRQTGIDLSLLAFTQKTTLWENSQRSLLPFSSEWMALAPGVYRWEMETEPLSIKESAGAPPPLTIVSCGENGFATDTYAWEKTESGRYVIRFQNLQKKVFLLAKSGDLQKQGLLLLRLTLCPDYLNSLRQGMIFRMQSKSESAARLEKNEER